MMWEHMSLNVRKLTYRHVRLARFKSVGTFAQSLNLNWFHWIAKDTNFLLKDNKDWAGSTDAQAISSLRSAHIRTTFSHFAIQIPRGHSNESEA